MAEVVRIAVISGDRQNSPLPKSELPKQRHRASANWHIAVAQVAKLLSLKLPFAKYCSGRNKDGLEVGLSRSWQ